MAKGPRNIKTAPVRALTHVIGHDAEGRGGRMPIEEGAVKSVNGRSGFVTIGKDDIGLANVDNTPDLLKPISNPAQAALDGKSDIGHTHLIGAIVGVGLLASLSAVNNSHWSGADLAVENGGTGASTPAAARNALGLAIGTDVQAYDAKLAAFAGLSPVADKLPYFTAANTLALTSFTSFARSLLDDADAATARLTLGLGSAAVAAATDFASAAQGALAASAIQPGSNRLVPAGGGAGYALIKTSAADYAFAWTPLPGGGDMLKTVYDPNGDGIIGLGQGGTGGTDAATARTNLGLAAVASSGAYADLAGKPALGSIASLSSINNTNWSGAALAIANGGTGAADAATARTNLGLATVASTGAYADLSGKPTLGSLAALSSINNANWSGTALSVANGGTGAITSAAARAALGAQLALDASGIVEWGGGLSGDRNVGIDFHSADSGQDWDARILRASGASGDLSILLRGGGNLAIQNIGTGVVYMQAATGIAIDSSGYFNFNGNPIWHEGRVQTLASANKYLPHYTAATNDGMAGARFSYSETAYHAAARVASTSAVAFGTGSKSFTVASGLALPAVGKVVTIKSATAAATAYMVGTVSSYSGTTLTVNVATSVGSGTYSDWTIQVAYDRYAVHINDRSWATGSGHYAETSYALGLSRIKPDLSVEGQTGCLNLLAIGGYTGSRDYVNAGYSAGDTAPLMGQAWLVGDLKSFVAWEEARTVINAGGGAMTSGLGNWCAARVQTLAGRWNGLTDYFGGKINGVQCIAEELPSMGIAFYAHNGTAGSWTYAFGTSAGAYIEMNGAVHTVSDPDTKEELQSIGDRSALLSVVTGADVCSWTYKADRETAKASRRSKKKAPDAPKRIGLSSRSTGEVRGIKEALQSAGLDAGFVVTTRENNSDASHDRFGYGARKAQVETVSVSGQIAILWGALQELASRVERFQS